MTPLLTRIAQQFNSSSDPDERAELMAERACYLARVGNFEEANSIVASLRRNYGDGHNARVSVWLMLAEGLILYFENLDIRSGDRIYRASVLGHGFHLEDLRLLSLSWLAHIQFNRSNFSQMVDALKVVVASPSPVPCGWAVRGCLILADAYAFSRESILSRHWYEMARRGATVLGDEATIGALIYNRAAIALTNMRLDAIDGKVDPERARLLRMEVDSSRNFQIHTKNSALNQLINSCAARATFLEGRYDESALIYQSLFEQQFEAINFDSNETQLKIEFIECLIKMGDIARAELLLGEIDPSQAFEFTADDLYIFMNSYANVVSYINPSQDVSLYRCKAAAAQEAYISSVHELKLLLKNIEQPTLGW